LIVPTPSWELQYKNETGSSAAIKCTLPVAHPENSGLSLFDSVQPAPTINRRYLSKEYRGRLLPRLHGRWQQTSPHTPTVTDGTPARCFIPRRIYKEVRRNPVRDSSVGITASYVLDGSEIEFRWERDFPLTSRPPLTPTQPPM
jgi:hypothetical protein